MTPTTPDEIYLLDMLRAMVNHDVASTLESLDDLQAFVRRTGSLPVDYAEALLDNLDEGEIP